MGFAALCRESLKMIRTPSRWLTALLLLTQLLTNCHSLPDPAAAEAPSNHRFNVLLIVADDLGEEVSPYGDPYARTPNLERFARRAVKYTNAYVTQSSCSPSRSSILTGLYPHQTGQVGLAHMGISMDSTYDNLFSLFHASGYTTGILGKLHVQPREAFPIDYGLGGGDTWISTRPDTVAMTVQVTDVDGTEKELVERFTRYDVDVVADSAAAFIHRSAPDPFMLMVNYLDPHRPFRNQIAGHPARPLTPDDVQMPGYLPPADEQLVQDVVGYYNGVSRFDEALGLLMDRMDELGLWGNTIVVVLGDHGAPLPNAKMTVSEAGLRIPLFVHYPGQSESAEYPGLVSTVDLLPTLLRLTGQPAPAYALPGMDLRQLQDGKVPPRTYLFAEYTRHVPAQLFPQRTVRDARYKLIYSPFQDAFAGHTDGLRTHHQPTYLRYAATPEWQLFDLREDPHERLNLIGTPGMDTIRDRLSNELSEWQHSTEDLLLTPAYSQEIRRQIGELLY